MSSYEKITGKVDELSSLSAVSFPDGSIDTYSEVAYGRAGTLESRERLADIMKSGSDSSFRLLPQRVEPGGQSVNMSQQLKSLGLATRQYGYMDHPVMKLLGFQYFSMGDPARVTVCEFEDGALTLAAEASDLLAWQLEDLEKIMVSLEFGLSADVVCCANWSSIPSMTSELEKLRFVDFRCEVFNFDPGDLAEFSSAAVKQMFDTLRLLDREYEVIIHANSDEVEAAAEIYGVEGSMNEKVNQLQSGIGVSAYILHDKERAVAGTDEGKVVVENLKTVEARTKTGAGDRFDAAVGAARAAGWDWEDALALGNTCAVNYVERNQTANADDVRDQIEQKHGKDC